MAKMRLDRLLAGQGTQTRKEVRELIRKGRVTVNGQPEKAADRQDVYKRQDPGCQEPGC